MRPEDSLMPACQHRPLCDMQSITEHFATTCQGAWEYLKAYSALMLTYSATICQKQSCIKANVVSLSSGVAPRVCALINPLSPAATHSICPPSNLSRPGSDLSWHQVISGKIPLLRYHGVMSFQGVACACLHASTVWTPCRSSASTLTGRHLVPVQLSLRAFMTHPMHTLMTAKGGAVRMKSICSIALIVPLKQQCVLRCFKSWLLCLDCLSFTTAGATTVVFYTCSNFSLPLMAADLALPFSPKMAASKRLLWCVGVFLLVPIFDLSWCLGSKRVVLAYRSPFTIWAFGSSCAAGNSCLPDMRASCRTIGA